MILQVVSIVVPLGGLPYRILHIKLVKPTKGTTMETIVRDDIFSSWLPGPMILQVGLKVRAVEFEVQDSAFGA